MAKSLASLAVIAGGGSFPKRVAQGAKDAGADVFIVHLDGHSSGFDGFPGMTARAEQLQSIFDALRARNISDIVLIGRMTRPSLLSLRPDRLTLGLLPKILKALCFGGDDALLRAVRGMLEEQGFTLHGAHEFVDGMLAPVGHFGGPTPDAAQLDDIRIGVDAARAHGMRDAGQGVVIRGGKIIALEKRAGTDAMVRHHASSGAILVKMAKPGQDQALDLPSIGPKTVEACKQAGYAGIAVEAGMTLVSDLEETTAMANRHNLFLIGVK